MKKLIALTLAAGMVFSLAACGTNTGAIEVEEEERENEEEIAENEELIEEEEAALEEIESEEPETSEEAEDTESDLAYVLDNGKLVVGITDFEPMDYQDENGDWIGFDADMANAFGEYIGTDVEFIEIDWDNKILELNSKSIDCVWNGMTLTDEVTSSMECTEAYCNNQQVVVVPTDIADQYQDVESLSDLSFAVEAGSAGEEQAVEYGLTYTPVESQSNALMEVAAGTSDAAIIDLLMAAAMIGEDTSYSDMTYTVGLNDEKYGVGFRQGSDLAEELNDFFKASYEDGTMMEIAEKYGVQASIIEQ